MTLVHYKKCLFTVYHLKDATPQYLAASEHYQTSLTCLPDWLPPVFLQHPPHVPGLHPGERDGGAGGWLRWILRQAQDDGLHLLPPVPHGANFLLLLCSSHQVNPNTEGVPAPYLTLGGPEILCVTSHWLCLRDSLTKKVQSRRRPLLIRHYTKQPTCPIWPLRRHIPILCLLTMG